MSDTLWAAIRARAVALGQPVPQVVQDALAEAICDQAVCECHED